MMQKSPHTPRSSEWRTIPLVVLGVGALFASIAPSFCAHQKGSSEPIKDHPIYPITPEPKIKRIDPHHQSKTGLAAHWTDELVVPTLS